MKLASRFLLFVAFLSSFVAACSCGARTPTPGPESIGPDTDAAALLDLEHNGRGQLDGGKRGRIGVGVGLGLDQPSAPFDPRTISGLQAYYHAEDAFWAANTPSTQAGWVPKLPDDSGNVRTLQANSNGAAPVYDTASMGMSALKFEVAKTSMLQVPTANAAQWTYLHDGTGQTSVALVRPTSSNAICTVYNTTGSTSSRGFWLYHDGTNDRFVAQLYVNSVTPILNIAGANGSSPEGANYVVVFTYVENASPEANLYVNGTLVASGNTTGAPLSTAPAFGGLAIGRVQAAGINYLEGYWARGLFYNRALATAERTQIEAGLSSLATPRTIRRIHTIGDSLTSATFWQQQFWERALASTTRLERIDFLGTLLAGDVSLWTDRQHNGHVGANIATITSDVNALGSLGFTADDVYVYAGTNNAAADMTAAQTDLATLVDTVRTKYPTARVLLMRPPRYLADPNKKIGMENFASWEQNTFCPQRQALGQNVVCRNGDVNLDSEISVDNIHPATPGYYTIGNHMSDAEGY